MSMHAKSYKKCRIHSAEVTFVTVFNLNTLKKLMGFALTHIFKQHRSCNHSVLFKIPGLVGLDEYIYHGMQDDTGLSTIKIRLVLCNTPRKGMFFHKTTYRFLG